MNFTPQLYHWESTIVPTLQEAEWAPEPVWTICKKRKLFHLPAFDPRVRPTRILSLHHLLYSSSQNGEKDREVGRFNVFNVHGSVHRNILVHNSNQMHKSQTLFYLTTALHVSGFTITHLQEHKITVPPLPRQQQTTVRCNGYQMLQLQLFCAPEDG